MIKTIVFTLILLIKSIYCSYLDKLSDYQIIQMIKSDCGEVCDTSLNGKPGYYFDVIDKNINCKLLFNSPLMELSSKHKSPPRHEEVPKNVLDFYTYQSRVPILSGYLDDSKGNTHLLKWDKEYIENIRELVRKDKLAGSYGIKETRNIVHHIKTYLSEKIKDGHVLVIGSQSPWIEAILLENGVGKITTLEYEPIDCNYPNISVITPKKMNEMFNEGHVFDFDAVISFSSLEHSGLGRYGDALNPWGDLIATAKAWCVTKPGGLALIGIPVIGDSVIFNIGKTYGPLQLSHFFANWRLVHTDAKKFPLGIDTPYNEREHSTLYGYQPIFIVEKPINNLKSKTEL